MSCTLVGDFCVSIRVKAVLVVGMYWGGRHLASLFEMTVFGTRTLWLLYLSWWFLELKHFGFSIWDDGFRNSNALASLFEMMNLGTQTLWLLYLKWCFLELKHFGGWCKCVCRDFSKLKRWCWWWAVLQMLVVVLWGGSRDVYTSTISAWYFRCLWWYSEMGVGTYIPTVIQMLVVALLRWQ